MGDVVTTCDPRTLERRQLEGASPGYEAGELVGPDNTDSNSSSTPSLSSDDDTSSGSSDTTESTLVGEMDDDDGVRFAAEEGVFALQGRMASWMDAHGMSPVDKRRVIGAFRLLRAKICLQEWDSMENAHEYDWCLSGRADRAIRRCEMLELPRAVREKRGFPGKGTGGGRTKFKYQKVFDLE